MTTPFASPPEAEVYSIAAVTRRIQELLQTGVGTVWVAGEISNLTISGAGHAYFTLKDEQAQLRGVMWRSSVESVPFELADGLDVLALGAIDVYAARGQYQITVRQLIPRGLGPLELAFRQLRDRLEKEGLFRPERKRPIPTHPRRAALVTSPAGAAVRDFLEVASRRWPALDVVVVPSAVQGDGCVAELCRALAIAQRLPGVEVIALVRGGGSLEDLWSFNSEMLARAIAASTIPVVSGVGHEIDVTIADLVADLRALTPSEAAERIFPDAGEISRRLDQLRDRSARALTSLLEQARGRLQTLEQRTWLVRPLAGVQELIRRVDDAEAKVVAGARRRLEQAEHQFASAAKTLHALSPLAVLNRGYSLVQHEGDGRWATSARELQPGEGVQIRFADGKAKGLIEKVEIDDGTGQGKL